MKNFTLEHTVCSYEDAKAFYENKLPQLLYPGCTVYIPDSTILYRVAGEIANDIYLCEDKSSNHREFITVKAADLYRAYNVSEIGILMPKVYTMPINTVRGWAWVGNDGNVILKDGYYKTEIEARTKYLLYFLAMGIVDSDDIKKSVDANFELL